MYRLAVASTLFFATISLALPSQPQELGDGFENRVHSFNRFSLLTSL